MGKNHYGQGRIFTEQQLLTLELEKAHIKPTMFKKAEKMYCGRCYQAIDMSNLLPIGKYYCRACIAFGRVESDSYLYYFDAISFPAGNYLSWVGQLTAYQKSVSDLLVSNYQNGKNSLVHAVTGAGKTEMIYKLMELVLNSGGWVCFSSPRVDVCIDIKNRLVEDFACSITILHGESGDYTPSPIVVATTHQLLKFYQAFDLLIIDEIDAFPFVGNHILNQATRSCLKGDGKVVCLTATSTAELEQKVKDGHYEKIKLSRRFHNYPLVVPKFQLIYALSQQIKKLRFPKVLKKLIANQRQSGFPLLIFYPIINGGESFTELLRKSFPEESIAFVSSKTIDRKILIETFKKREINILVTTTILERGVTFPEVDVFVILANHKLFTSSSLIQISGRVGRSINRPTGNLLFIHEGISKAMIKARKEIIVMNKEAYG
ncbi:DEAD/DEAH box helicase [Streptococcus hongkongensis]|nr:competence protein [Streptococcus uberis]